MQALRIHPRSGLSWKAGIAITAAILAMGTACAPGAHNATDTAASASTGSTICRDVRVTVRIGDQSGPIAGTLCQPPRADVVQLLLAGWTYDRQYFEWPYQPATYSYVRAANLAGYATLAIDRLGTGASLHPISLFDTLDADARTVHSVIQALRNGSFGVRYRKVISVGHSLGSIVAMDEAGIYNDVNALITTGATHTPNYASVMPRIVGRDYPAATDPRFSGARWAKDPLYVTSIPGGRKYLYYRPDTDPKVPALDENLKAVDTLTEVATASSTYSFLNADQALNIPVYEVVGDHDTFFCGLAAVDCTSARRLAAHEGAWYGPHAAVSAYVVPHAGHDFQLERSAPGTTAHMLAFAGKYIGPGTGEADTKPGVMPPLPGPPPVHYSLLDTAAQAAFVKAVLPAMNAYSNAIDPVPGLGTTANPVQAADDLLPAVANADGEVLATLPHRVLGTL